MKRILSLLLVLLLLFCSFGCNEEVPNHEEPPADLGELVTDGDITYYTGRQIEQIYFSENKLYYTLSNQTNRSLSYDPNIIRMQKWENEQWTFCPIFQPILNIERNYTIAPHSKTRSYAKDIRTHAVTPGKYRLIVGDRAPFYWVGQFTVTEEQAAAYPKIGDVCYKDGFWQSEDVSVFILPHEQPPYLYEFVLHNKGSVQLTIPAKDFGEYFYQHVRMERWLEDDKWDREGFHWSQEWIEEDARIYPGDSFRFSLHSSSPNLPNDPRYVPEDGYYRLTLQCYWEGDVDNVFSVRFFFRSQDGVITEGTPPVPDAP